MSAPGRGGLAGAERGSWRFGPSSRAFRPYPGGIGEPNVWRDGRARTLASPYGVMRHEKDVMSTYKVIEVIGTSATSWEDAAAQAIKTAGDTLHDLRVAEVLKQDIHLDEGGGITFRTKLQLSFKYEHEH